MTANLVHGDDFTALTIHDTAGASLNIERTDDGHVSAWIAPPGGNDGPSVQLDEADVAALVAYLSAGTPGALVPAAELAEVRAQNEKLTALADAASRWRAQFSKPANTKFPRMAALIAAVDALPNMQEPCDICSGYGCPDCREQEPCSWSAVPEPDIDRVVGGTTGTVYVRTTFPQAPPCWWAGEPGAGVPLGWAALLAGEGTLTEVADEQVTA
ncbi:hypothetical protein GCM10011608_09360 [Micromonospora sonchi]|uniref:Uncharacterized protein n=1 Tax=Micromonospora sonchi TaxID=1763543 RepID=A0A917TMS6_9ACTN|nr:hypothetical protein [Micromonospora sonchi]GGM26646.1 hypothetical protein GCM10011608_09360 [Micromonospora sonchi]